MEIQKNEITGVAYKGRNQADLMEAKMKQGYLSNGWITFMQAKQAGKKLVNAKGKGVHLLRFSYQDEEEETKGGKGFVKGFVVFNMDLVEDNNTIEEQDDIQENTDSMEEKLEQLQSLSI